MLLLFYQGSYAAFADVPRINSAGWRKVNRKGPERDENLVSEVIAPQIVAVQSRETTALARLHALESKAAAQLETLAKATVARRQAAVVKQRAVVAGLNAEIETLNAAMAVETARMRQQTDLIFVFSILDMI